MQHTQHTTTAASHTPTISNETRGSRGPCEWFHVSTVAHSESTQRKHQHWVNILQMYLVVEIQTSMPNNRGTVLWLRFLIEAIFLIATIGNAFRFRHQSQFLPPWWRGKTSMMTSSSFWSFVCVVASACNPKRAKCLLHLLRKYFRLISIDRFISCLLQQGFDTNNSSICYFC